jgi:hypothetical protein
MEIANHFLRAEGSGFEFVLGGSESVEPVPEHAIMVTTIAAMTKVAASSTRKLPLSVAPLITVPRPVVENICPRKRKYSATMLAFHAPQVASSLDSSTRILEQPWNT